MKVYRLILMHVLPFFFIYLCYLQMQAYNDPFPYEDDDDDGDDDEREASLHGSDASRNSILFDLASRHFSSSSGYGTFRSSRSNISSSNSSSSYRLSLPDISDSPSTPSSRPDISDSTYTPSSRPTSDSQRTIDHVEPRMDTHDSQREGGGDDSGSSGDGGSSHGNEDEDETNPSSKDENLSHNNNSRGSSSEGDDDDPSDQTTGGGSSNNNSGSSDSDGSGSSSSGGGGDDDPSDQSSSNSRSSDSDGGRSGSSNNSGGGDDDDPSDDDDDDHAHDDNSDDDHDDDDDDDSDDSGDDDDDGQHARVSKGKRCPFCKISLPTEERLAKHLTKYHLRTDRFHCEVCGKDFGRLDNLRRHQKRHNKDQQSVKCPICGKEFSRRDSLARHVRNVHHKKRKAESPSSRRAKKIREHGDVAADGGEPSNAPDDSTGEERDRTAPPSDNDEEGRDGSAPLSEVNDDDMNEGGERDANVVDEIEVPIDVAFDGILTEDPRELPHVEDDNDDDDEEYDDDDDDDEEVRVEQLIRDNWNSIRSHHRVGRNVQEIYNFRIGHVGGLEQVGGGGGLMERRLRAIFERQRRSFKINLSYGFILRNVETGELRYFHPSSNNHRFLDVPHIIRDEADMERFIEAVISASVSIRDYATRHRPNTKWTLVRVSNVSVYVNKLQFTIGSGVQLPPYITNNKAVYAMTTNQNTGRPYKDNLCFFRCLATHKGGSVRNRERDTAYYYERFLEAHPQPDGKFKGLFLEDLPAMEELFGLNIQVYTLLEQHGEEVEEEEEEEEARNIVLDGDDQDEDKDQNMDDDDDVVINNQDVDQDVDGVGADNTQHEDGVNGENPKIAAELVWRSRARHADTMNLNLFGNHFSYIIDLKLYSKAYQCSKCGKIFTSGYRVKRHELTCDNNVTHVFPGGAYSTPPTIFEKLEKEDIDTSDDMRFFSHRATFDFECFFDEVVASQQTLKFKVEAHHVPLSVSVASNVDGYESAKHFVTDGDPHNMVQQMVCYLEEVSCRSEEILRDEFQPVIEQLESKLHHVQNRPTTNDRAKKKRLQQLFKLRQELDEYICTLPVLGFNSARYDLNLVREYLYPALFRMGKIKQLIKKGNAYQCIQTATLKFLDITNYLAPGYSYRQFLKAYGAEAGKGFFPYEWFNSLEKLDYPSLPPHAAFFSKLKNENISEEEYRYCQEIWETHDMTTMRDFLHWYNDLDVAPFLVAIDNMFSFYKSLGVDMFKDAISVPGLTLKYLFSTLNPTNFFTLFNEKDKDWYYRMRQNIVGGPSIIFHRYHEAGVTRIRKGTTECAEVVGYDANALYLWSLMQDMPTGPYITRSVKDHFKPVHAYAHGETAVQWLDWVAHSESISIQHQFNRKERRIGVRQIPVDGYCKETKTVYQFHGCYFHGHRCHLNNKTFNKTKNCSMEELRRQTAETSKYIKEEGYNLVEIWECEWRELIQTNSTIKSFVQEHTPPFRHQRDMTEDEIIQAVMKDELFGVVECDITVPSHLETYFEEMPPIFKNCMVSREDIGPHMQAYAEENGLLSQPRRTLIGSMKASNILLITPLLKWYIRHGLEVTAVHEVLQYQPEPCFTDFGKTVVDARRAGDVDPSQAVVAETMKLIGNSAYGKTITNKERFRDVEVCCEKDAPLKINSAYFRQLDMIGDDLCEVHFSKKTIKMDLPIQIGFFVYGYAKLRMLSFYYDFVDRFIDRSNYQYCSMDTDSAYMALSGPFDTLIIPERQEEFEEVKHQWLPRVDTEENVRYDRREPGLFKEEWRGDGIVALCSKTYYCFGGKKDKLSCKGLNKRQSRPLTAQRFLDVLSSKTTGSGVNRGFRLVNGKMVTYTQQKNALSYLYIKRKVGEDGISTSPLDV